MGARSAKGKKELAVLSLAFSHQDFVAMINPSYMSYGRECSVLYFFLKLNPVKYIVGSKVCVFLAWQACHSLQITTPEILL